MAASPVPHARLETPGELVLRAALTAYLGRYRGLTRQHSESDLRVFLHWCTDHDLDPAYRSPDRHRTLGRHGRVLVVVDQPASIGALPVAVARAVGCQIAYLPGLTMRRGQ
jgi:hypothetical protein